MHVTCQTPACDNGGVTIEVPEGPPTHCGLCEAELAPPTASQDPPDHDQIAELLERVKALEEATPTT